MQKIKYLIPLFFACLLTSCEDIASYKGQYIGIHKISNENEKNVILFFDPKNLQSQKHTDIVINELRASAEPQILKISFLEDENWLQVRWENKTRTLKVHKTEPCLQANSKNELLKICFNKDQIKIDFQDKNTAESILQLSVKKTDDLSTSYVTGLTIDELLGRTKYINYTVMQKAEGVYRAKSQISLAYRNLLPRLNLRDVLSFALGPFGFVEAIGNLVPFVFPSNWYKFEQSKDLSKAETASYASLRGNEMHTVEALSYLHLRNIEISKYLEQEITWLKEVQKHLETREQIGDIPQGTSILLSVKIGSLSLDKEQLDLYIQNENSLIAHSIGSPVGKSLQLANLPRIDISRSETISAETCMNSVPKNSHEVAAINHMIKASQNQSLEAQYSFLDPNSDGALGIGTPTLIRIGKSHVNELKIRQKEIISLLQKGCTESVNERNTSVRTYNMSWQYLKQSQNLKNILSQKIILEGNFSTEVLLELVANSENLVKFKSQALSSETQFRVSESKLNRLTLNGFYKNLEVGL